MLERIGKVHESQRQCWRCEESQGKSTVLKKNILIISLRVLLILSLLLLLLLLVVVEVVVVAVVVVGVGVGVGGNK